MHSFLINNRDELIARCKLKVAQRTCRAVTEKQLVHGVPMFIDQLTRTLATEENGQPDISFHLSGPAGEDAMKLSEIGVIATAHGDKLLVLGYSVDQVVHDYRDLCQAITDLAFEQNKPFAVDEFRTLNRCLDNAMAYSVTEFSFQRETRQAELHFADERQRLGFLSHELRNALGTAAHAVHALEVSCMPVAGAVGAVLKRSLSTLELLIGNSLAKACGETQLQRQTFPVAAFIAEAADAGRLDARYQGCIVHVNDVDPLLALRANRELLHAALANLLHNAFKFTAPNTVVTLSAHAFGESVLIDVADHCGGLTPHGSANMFIPFMPNEIDRAGSGLGLSIARQSVEADSGTLTVRNVPGTGCVFTINLPRYSVP